MERRIAETQQRLGASYRVWRDEQTKTVIVSDLPDNDVDDYRQDLRLYQEALHAAFFEHLPDRWILVLIPANAEDYNKKLGGSSTAAGFYDSGTRTLTVNPATGGGTMIHEWTHVLNIADQDARGQSHPLWILEGFGSLYEQVALNNGRAVGYTNWRLPQVQNLIRNGAVAPMRDFVLNSQKYFDRDPAAAYAQSRYMFYYLQEKNLLPEFYRTYVAGYSEDRAGLVALQKVLGKKVEDWFGEWKEFTLGLTFGNTSPRPWIGVQIDTAAGRLRITRVIEDSGAAEAGLKAEDLILAADGEDVLTPDDVQKILLRKKRGDLLTLRISRGGKAEETRVKLQ